MGPTMESKLNRCGPNRPVWLGRLGVISTGTAVLLTGPESHAPVTGWVIRTSLYLSGRTTGVAHYRAVASAILPAAQPTERLTRQVPRERDRHAPAPSQRHGAAPNAPTPASNRPARRVGRGASAHRAGSGPVRCGRPSCQRRDLQWAHCFGSVSSVRFFAQRCPQTAQRRMVRGGGRFGGADGLSGTSGLCGKGERSVKSRSRK